MTQKVYGMTDVIHEAKKNGGCYGRDPAFS